MHDYEPLETGPTLRRKAAVFARLAAEAHDEASRQELSKLSDLYFQDATELEAAQ